MSDPTLAGVDPELAGLIEPVAWIRYSGETLPELRALLGDSPPAVSTETVTRTDRVVAADPDVVVRVHCPPYVIPGAPAILGLHGGGYIFGNRSLDDQRFEHWCAQFGCIGVSVEYRLAPDHPYPAALDDAHAALRWLFEQADGLGIDAERVGLFGLSAGGGLAAALALRVRDEGEHCLRFQILEAPMLDDRRQTPSSRQPAMPMWDAESNAYGWQQYLGDLAGTQGVPAYAAAARAEDLAGLPATFVSVGTIDGLRDESVQYASRLNQAGVPTELHVYAGAPHGFQLFAGTALADRANRDLDDWLRVILELD